MKSKVLVATLAACGISLFAISDAHPAPVSFSFDIDATQGVFGSPGSTTVLATETVDSSVVGRSCQVTIDVHNNESVRQGTDVLISSANATLTATNVEAIAGDAPPAVLGQLVLGGTVAGAVRFGPEGAASVRATITVDCPDVAPTTTTQPATVVGGVGVTREAADVVAAQPALAG
jgi:hypothetical protein